jgi:hypothetical protein
MTRPPRGITRDEWEAMVRAAADKWPPPTDAQLNRMASILRTARERERALTAGRTRGSRSRKTGPNASNPPAAHTSEEHGERTPA